MFYQVYAGIFSHTQCYSGIFIPIETLSRDTQAYSDIFRSLFKTRALFKTLQNVDQAYSEPCHRASFSHIQQYSEPCAETWHTWNPGIFKTFPSLHPDAYSEPCHVSKNLRIFRTLTYLKPDTYSEPSQKIRIEFFAKIVENYNYFSKALHIVAYLEPCVNLAYSESWYT